MNWQSTQRVLYRNAAIYAVVGSNATAMMVEGDRIAWIGDDAEIPAHHGNADVVLDMHGALVTPAFVDAHASVLDTPSSDAVAAARAQAAALGIVAIQDFSAAAAAGVGVSILEQPGTLIYPFRSNADHAAFGVHSTLAQSRQWLEVIEAGLPLAIEFDPADDDDAVRAALASVVERIGLDRVRRAVIRAEAAAGFSDGLLTTFHQHEIAVVVQAHGVRPFSSTSPGSSGLAFGSFADALADPWATVQAAVSRRPGTAPMTLLDAFAATTRAGWAALGRPTVGQLASGRAAHFAVWDASAVANGLPGLETGKALPTCLRTVIAGTVVFDNGALLS